MNTINKIRDEVVERLQSEPDLDAKDIIVDVAQGVVTLSGYVHSLAQKKTVERVAKDVSGVKAIALNLHVLCPLYDSDTEIAVEIADQFAWHPTLCAEPIRAIVDNAWVTLEGEVKEQCHKVAAFNAVNGIKKVKGVFNRITVCLPRT
ncbi:Osmotically-inducible protein OsmY, contains BON domain [Parapedobacter koreensis]|uniref:Osmotically-inducible protein OsmY, contains BON domain n=2 Tax=Parapedobacter koreensis TaxID=332977 RepID=A0A1H7MYQ2_9SPHI|nr:Osmotically-inducible protein OsmY, contains BON domain [Parapedobacter koreensis]